MDLEIKEDKLAPVRIYQRQVWLDEYNKPIYKEIRDKVLDAFKDLVFIEEGHKYFVGDRSLTSVTTLIGNFEPHFDADAQAPRTMAKYFDDETSIYYQKTVDEIKEMWKANNKRATTHGSERHEFAESVFHFMTHNYDAILPAFKDRLMQDENGVDYFLAINAKEIAVSKVYKDIPDCVVPILAETKVYNIKDEYAYSGTFDILFYYNAELNGKDKSKSGLYVLDWKTNKDIYKNINGQTMEPPFTDMRNMPKNGYVLQLNAYQMALEKIGLNVIARMLFWLLPDGSYQKVPLENMTERLEKALVEKGIK